jgi:formylglycine-generating enzyme required for sulfatase activity
LTRATLGKPTDPKYYQTIFERGVDPDVEDPEQCHAHSETPDEWPPLDEILDYQERVRSRARSLLQDSKALQDRTIGEALWIGFEHEAMHLETFLYMLLQSEKTQPPSGIDTPDFTQMARDTKRNAKPNKWFRIPRQTIIVGLDDSDKDAVPKDSYGWDNEQPQMKINVHAFEARAQPITNGEYAKYLQANRSRAIPASWLPVNPEQAYPIAKGISRSSPGATEEYLNNFAVRTVLGSVPLELAQDWPVIASYDELANYAKWVECRIPTFEEVKSIYQFSDRLKEGTAGQKPNSQK